jgi:hypothetical protein
MTEKAHEKFIFAAGQEPQGLKPPS